MNPIVRLEESEQREAEGVAMTEYEITGDLIETPKNECHFHGYGKCPILGGRGRVDTHWLLYRVSGRRELFHASTCCK